uniref:NADH-ubiquinone oxidoreductase chain 2 n=1 Tax=Pedicinus obtusus TaxID=592408 RepID=A0A7L9CWG5_9NEOP|nr:NADH dehydrogenase subunit 2 [Pedicinus obtusus]
MNFLISSLIVLSCTMAVSASSWWSLWLFMELGLFWFIPTMVRDSSALQKSSMWLYFMVQVISSSFLLVMIVLEEKIMAVASLHHILSVGMFFCILLKLGMPPFHSWALLIADGLPSFSYMVMNTVMKIPPLVMVFNMSYKFSYGVVHLAAVFGAVVGLGGLTEYSIRRFLLYSSFGSISLSMLGMTNTPTSVWMMLIVYFVSMWGVISILKEKWGLSSGLLSSTVSSTKKMLMFTLMLNVMGVPPSLMFFLKLDIIFGLTQSLGPFPIQYVFLIITSMMALASVYLILLHFQTLWNGKSYLEMNNSKTKGVYFILILQILMSCILFFM